MARKAKRKFDPKAFLARADGGVTVSNYRKGQTVFAQGDPADSIFYIQQGKIKVSVVSEQGKEAVVAFLTAGDFIREGCLTGRPRRVSTARAMTDCMITRMDKATIVRMLQDEPKFSELLPRLVSQRTGVCTENSTLIDYVTVSPDRRCGWQGHGEPGVAEVEGRLGGASSLAEEPIVRLILDGTVVRVRLDRLVERSGFGVRCR